MLTHVRGAGAADPAIDPRSPSRRRAPRRRARRGARAHPAVDVQAPSCAPRRRVGDRPGGRASPVVQPARRAARRARRLAGPVPLDVGVTPRPPRRPSRHHAGSTQPDDKETPMSADQFLTLDGRPTVRVERRYPHPIEKVWRAVTTPRASRPVVPEPRRDRPAAGRTMRFAAFEGQPGATGTVEVVDAPRRLDVHVGHRPTDVRAGA